MLTGDADRRSWQKVVFFFFTFPVDCEPLPVDVTELYDALEAADSDHPFVLVCRGHRLFCDGQLASALEVLLQGESWGDIRVTGCEVLLQAG